jgi:hypothetical protein
MRFRRTTSRGHDLPLAAPLPPTLATIDEVVPFIEEHARIVARLDELRTRVVEARLHLEKVEEGEIRKIERAAREGKPAPKARGGGAAERSLELAERELRAFAETVVPNSADKLLADALPYVEQAGGLVAQEQERALKRAEDALAQLDGALEGVQLLADEAFWIAQAQIRTSNGSAVEPFRSYGGDRRVAQLRAALRRAWDEFVCRREAEAAEEARIRAWEDANRDAWAAREEQARRQQEEGRVVIDHSSAQIVERGGRPVRRAPFGGVEEVEEE